MPKDCSVILFDEVTYDDMESVKAELYDAIQTRILNFGYMIQNSK